MYLFTQKFRKWTHIWSVDILVKWTKSSVIVVNRKMYINEPSSLNIIETSPWASYQIRKLVGCTHAGMPETFSPPLTLKETASWLSRHVSRHVRHRHLTRGPWTSCQIAAGLGSNTYFRKYLYLYLYLYLNTYKMKYLYLYLIGVFGCIWQIYFKYTFHFYTLIYNDTNNKYNNLHIS